MESEHVGITESWESGGSQRPGSMLVVGGGSGDARLLSKSHLQTDESNKFPMLLYNGMSTGKRNE